MNFDLLDVKNLVTTFDRAQPTGDPFLDGRYQWQTETFTEKPYYRLFYHLSEMLRPGLVVELGAWRCTGAANWATHAGQVITIDHHSDPGDDENERWCMEAVNHYPNLVYLKGWTWDVVGQVPDEIGVLFIDSWHVYDKAMRDWDAYRPLLDPGGALVICDDIENTPPTMERMVEFWEDVSDGYERFLVKGIAPAPMGFFKYVE